MEESKAGGDISGSDKVRRSKDRKKEGQTSATQMALEIKGRIRDIDHKCFELRAEQRGLEVALTIVERYGIR